MASFIRGYNSLLLRRPMFASCATAIVLYGAGDVIAQQVVEKKGSNHDYARTARLTFYGGAVFGPCISTWYRYLNMIKFKTPTGALVSRVALDQIVLTPVAIACFFGAMSVMEGKAEEAKDRIERAFTPTLIRNWAVFVPTQLVNFSVVPPHLRFLFVSVVSLFWNTYLSVANSKGQQAAIDID